jgi:D-tyrosyl-tRNA(Tyr) deacylase
MRAVVQRVTRGAVRIDGESVGGIGHGLVVLLGVADDDTPKDADWMAAKLVNLRIFEDNAGKLNRSLLDCSGEMLVISQFTLYGDCRKGRRPSFIRAAGPEKGDALYRRFIQQVQHHGVDTATGRFGHRMDVSLNNHGPVTLIVESP